MNRQLEFMFPYKVPEDAHPMSPILVRALGLQMQPDMINDLCVFLFDMVGLKLHDVRPRVEHFSWGWDDPRKVDIRIPGADKAAVWSPLLPPGLRIDAERGRLRGTLEEGPWECDIHIGPAVKYDALGGSGSPNEPGVWIGALEERQPVETPPIDVSTLTAEQRAALLAELTKGEED